jgi:murein DD-endopeptidase MepM/ murein hydrolase activator NlpD
VLLSVKANLFVLGIIMSFVCFSCSTAPNQSSSARFSRAVDFSHPDNIKFQWPLENPVFNEHFGWRKGRLHEGVDLKAVVGTPVYAAAEGKVVYAGARWKKSYGKMVIIEHIGGWSTLYAHLSKIHVRANQKVGQGFMIAHSGATGRVSGPHLHLELRKGADPVDPVLFFPYP